MCLGVVCCSSCCAAVERVSEALAQIGVTYLSSALATCASPTRRPETLHR
jgi:hypothetical protein